MWPAAAGNDLHRDAASGHYHEDRRTVAPVSSAPPLLPEGCAIRFKGVAFIEVGAPTPARSGSSMRRLTGTSFGLSSPRPGRPGVAAALSRTALTPACDPHRPAVPADDLLDPAAAGHHRNVRPAVAAPTAPAVHRGPRPCSPATGGRSRCARSRFPAPSMLRRARHAAASSSALVADKPRTSARGAEHNGREPRSSPAGFAATPGEPSRTAVDRRGNWCGTAGQHFYKHCPDQASTSNDRPGDADRRPSATPAATSAEPPALPNLGELQAKARARQPAHLDADTCEARRTVLDEAAAFEADRAPLR